MKFDYVIGNPPYQQETSEEVTTNGQRSRKNIFHYFQISADAISNESSVLIYPGGRWIHQSGKGLKQFGLAQINDNRLSEVMLYADGKDVFGSAADLADGVSIVVKKQNKTEGGFRYIFIKDGKQYCADADNPGNELMPLDPRNFAVLRKIDEFVCGHGLSYLHDAILPRSLFSIESEFVEKNPDLVRPYVSDKDVDFSREIKLYTNDKAGKAGRAKWYVADKSVITSNIDKINEYQVVVSSANAGGQKRDNQIAIVDNHSAFGRARVALRSFITYDEAKHFLDYAQTYLIRYAFLMTDEALTTLAKRVPDILDYSERNPLIDFSGDLDTQLFKLAELSSDEIKYVCDVVDSVRKKEMA